MAPTNETPEKNNKVIKSMADLEQALDLIPISRTPPYFAEGGNKDKVSIIAGAADTFWYDANADADNPWVGQIKEWSEKYNTPGKAGSKITRELNELEQKFKEAGFNNFYYLPATTKGMINWIYINNAMAAGFDSKGEPLLYFGNMKNGNRKPEPALVEFFLSGAGYDFGYNIPNLLDKIKVAHAMNKEENRNWTMEGKGDQLPMSLPVMEKEQQSQDKFYHLVVNCSGRRTHPQALEEYALKSGNYVVEIPLSDDPKNGAYHGNVAIFYFQKKDKTRGVTYIPEMLASEKRDFIDKMFSTFFGKENVYKITSANKELYEEGINRLTMNVISVGAGKIISSAHHCHTNRFITEELGLEILKVDLQAITLGGGGLQCCYTAINHQPLEIIRNTPINALK